MTNQTGVLEDDKPVEALDSNTRDPKRVSPAYSVDSQWRNHDVFVNGREQIVEFLTGKWDKEIDYRLAKRLWALTENRTAGRPTETRLSRMSLL
ncbi:hypothetical protein Q31b_50530 [Novipirellula aureliae]|uniref:Uncharacterized protein n=1 Tax=Novipirellula aureliae TaxID=2527966 RepID=A0A5C6DFX9_9BACT|nr:hypothetical protein Q31b_50530 [Novipirellula aureliae]